jgi:hypothetical protein
MPYNYLPQPASHQPTASEYEGFRPGRECYLTTARRSTLCDDAPPTEPIPRGLPLDSLAGQLRLLELQRDNQNRASAHLRAQQSPASA